MAMTYVTSAMGSASKAKEMLANQKLAERQRQLTLKRVDNDYFANKASVDRTQMENDLKIEDSKLSAQDNFKRSFAGSGISGQTINEMDAQIASDTAQAHTANKYQSELSGAQLHQNRMNEIDGANEKMNSVAKFDAKAENMDNLFAAGASGAQSYASMGKAEKQGLHDSVSNWFSQGTTGAQTLSAGNSAGMGIQAPRLMR